MVTRVMIFDIIYCLYFTSTIKYSCPCCNKKNEEDDAG